MPHCGPRPKKPVNSFIMWINSAGRTYIRAMHPGHEMWAAMVDEEKVVWHEAARTAMANYKKKSCAGQIVGSRARS
ncbi:uncharacterized protein LOC116802619 [Drosophila sechellia]|uniref:uncharacterized protein LOC116802619 n=1 Tax=Drosophila sechellia TaxID=7238 RepID=UPI0013DDC4F3|nr:uncharacterized protein LOC116802619 [Drosophila sechellia]